MAIFKKHETFACLMALLMLENDTHSGGWRAGIMRTSSIAATSKWVPVVEMIALAQMLAAQQALAAR